MLLSSETQIQDADLDSPLYNHVCAKLSDLDLEMVYSIPPGGNWKDIPEKTALKSKRVMKIRESGGRTTYYGRMKYDLPAYTINTYFNRPGNGTFIHPDQNRLISIREAARLQSFTDDYRFLGSTSSMYKQVGNAVPPLLSRALGKILPSGNVIDLFAGAGGLSEGLKQAGHDIVLATDLNHHMCESYDQNHEDTTVLNLDILNPIDYQTLCEEIETRLKGQTLNLLAGGPPCQGFSTAGHWNTSDERNSLVYMMYDFAELFQPEWLVIENVLGIKWMNKGEILESLKDRLSTLGYTTEIFSLHAEEFGVPQRRRRVFILSNRDGCDIPKPEPIFSSVVYTRKHQQIKLINSDLPPPITVREAISDLPPLDHNMGEHQTLYNPERLESYYQLLMRGAISFDTFIRHRAEQH